MEQDSSTPVDNSTLVASLQGEVAALQKALASAEASRSVGWAKFYEQAGAEVAGRAYEAVVGEVTPQLMAAVVIGGTAAGLLDLDPDGDIGATAMLFLADHPPLAARLAWDFTAGAVAASMVRPQEPFDPDDDVKALVDLLKRCGGSWRTMGQATASITRTFNVNEDTARLLINTAATKGVVRIEAGEHCNSPKAVVLIDQEDPS